MNRIRKFNNNYQVLITPYHRFDTSFELMLGLWTDDYLRNYSITTFQTMEEAMELAFTMPDIDWFKLVLFSKDSYVKLNKIIRQIVNENNFIVEYEPHLMTPEELKETMFNRVMINGDRFRLDWNLNDVIGFHIVNPWSSNLRSIYSVLKTIPELRLMRSQFDNGVITLIGETDIGTTYSIILWPTLIYQYAKWSKINPNVSDNSLATTLANIINMQKQIDNGIVLR